MLRFCLFPFYSGCFSGREFAFSFATFTGSESGVGRVFSCVWASLSRVLISPLLSSLHIFCPIYLCSFVSIDLAS